MILGINFKEAFLHLGEDLSDSSGVNVVSFVILDIICDSKVDFDSLDDFLFFLF
jgi:hypothetical protein